MSLMDSAAKLFIEKNKFKLLLSTLLLALAVRISVFNVVFSNGSITFLGADTYYHARRILATVAQFPQALAFDSYIDFPYGSSIGWPPLYDQFTALIALIAGAGKPSVYTIEATTAIVPPLLGVLTVLLVFLIAEKFFDWRVGLISAGIFAITPSHVYVSFLGYADHHVAETFLSTAAYLFFIIAMKNLQKNRASFGNFTNILKKSSYPAFTGIVLALSIFTWDGAPIFIGLISIYVLIQFIIDRKFGRNSDYLIITGGIAFLVSLLIITPVAVSHGSGFEIYSYLPTLFHVGFLTAFFFLCVLLGLMQKMQLKKWWYHPLLLLLIFIAAASSIEILSPQFYHSAAEGIKYLLGGGILATIQEAVPLFKSPEGFTLDNAWNAFTISFFIALLSFVYFINKTIKEKYPLDSVFLIVWTLIVLVLTILQKRFIYLLAVNVAVFSAYFIIAAAKPFESNEKETKKRRKKQQKSRSIFYPKPIIIISLLALLGIPNIIVINSMAKGIAAPDPDLRESFRWLRDNSPPTSNFENPTRPAEYGIMSWWDYGNWILYLAQRPVVANNFQTGLNDAAHFLIEQDEKTVNEIMDKRQIRFVVTDAQMLKLKFSFIAMLAGKKPGDYYGNSEGAQIRSVNKENRKFFATMLSRLHVFDGDGLSHYRLIHESNTTAIRNPDIKYVKIFEYVRGARISGRASGGEVRVTLNIITNQGRTFVYLQQATAKNGSYELTVPYSTLGGRYETKSLGDYILQSASISTLVQVGEQDVLEGRVIRADLI